MQPEKKEAQHSLIIDLVQTYRVFETSKSQNGSIVKNAKKVLKKEKKETKTILLDSHQSG